MTASAIAMSLASVHAAGAATIHVAAGEAAIGANGLCSLREAVANANDDGPTYPDCPAGNGADQINLPAATYELASGIAREADTALVVASEMVIQGAGAFFTRLDAGGALRHILVEPGGVLTLAGVWLFDGSVESLPGPGPFEPGRGGAIRNFGNLIVQNAVLTGNSAVWGGAIFNSGPASMLSITGSLLAFNGRPATDNSTRGGAIYNEGQATISSTDLTLNEAERGGAVFGASGGAMTMLGVTLDGNEALHGGAIALEPGATAEISFAVLSGNVALMVNLGDFGYLGAEGGAIMNAGALEISFATLSGNESEREGGAIFNDEQGQLEIYSAALSGNVSSFDGGAILNEGEATITLGVFDENEALQGGAIRSRTNASLTIEESTLSNNNAGTGGALHNLGSLTIGDTTFRGNSGTLGAAIFNFGNDFPPTVIRNSTLSGNRASGIERSPVSSPHSGAAIENYSALVLMGVTASGNTDQTLLNFGTISAANTILVNSGGVNCLSPFGFSSSSTNNLDDDGSCGGPANGFASVASALLGVLQDNGGPTETHLPHPASPAIHAGDQPACDFFSTDQRGSSRTAGPRCDVGATELEASRGVTSLVHDVENLEIEASLKRTLLSRLDSAVQAIERGQTGDAASSLREFVNDVEAERGQKIEQQDAVRLTTGARNMIEVLEQPPDPRDL